jgi:PhnB protein
MATELIPSLTVDNGAKAIDFYKAAFGATEVMRAPHKGSTKIMHSELKIGSFRFFVNDDFPEMCGGKSKTPKALTGSPITLFLTGEDCDAAVARATKAGATVTMPPMDMFWGDRFAKLTDPFGHEWSITSPISEERKKKAMEAQKEWM